MVSVNCGVRGGIMTVTNGNATSSALTVWNSPLKSKVRVENCLPLGVISHGKFWPPPSSPPPLWPTVTFTRRFARATTGCTLPALMAPMEGISRSRRWTASGRWRGGPTSTPRNWRVSGWVMRSPFLPGTASLYWKCSVWLCLIGMYFLCFYLCFYLYM